ncbi:MAG: glycosyltransferase family 2 protein [Pyrinomonadaceae bacterium]
MPNSYKLLTVIIPVYNEKSTIAEVIEKVSAVELPLVKEIIVVDDGSTDGTTEILQAHNKSKIVFYFTPVNIGKGAAVRIGLKLAKGDIILIQDADLELDPNEYKMLLQPILQGQTQVVYGSRFLKKNKVPLVRRLANGALTSITNKLYNTKLTDMETAYKIFTANVANKLALQANRFEIEPEITARICQAGYKIAEVPISYRPRTKFEGKKINWKDGVKAMWMLCKCRLERRKVLKEKFLGRDVY